MLLFNEMLALPRATKIRILGDRRRCTAALLEREPLENLCGVDLDLEILDELEYADRDELLEWVYDDPRDVDRRKMEAVLGRWIPPLP